jgi:hypothetical protein
MDSAVRFMGFQMTVTVGSEKVSGVSVCGIFLKGKKLTGSERIPVTPSKGGLLTTLLIKIS